MLKIGSLLRRHGRRAAKALWWLITPWHARRRLAALRQRALIEEQGRQRQDFLRRERSRLEGWRLDQKMPYPSPMFDLFDDDSVQAVARLPLANFLWPKQDAAAVSDPWSAARLCIDLLRSDKNLRARFPRALSDGSSGPFGAWLGTPDAALALGLSGEAQRMVVGILDQQVAARARQALMVSEDVRLVLPHGLTPSGQPALFFWFMNFELNQGQLRLEEVWWLFLQSREDPFHELKLAYLFTPIWQQENAEALTVFGESRFLEWFARSYPGASSWLNSTHWPSSDAPVVQLRRAYWARPVWQKMCPLAMSDASQAIRLLNWLLTTDAGLSESALEWCRSLDVDGVATQLASPGLNVIGHFCYPSGLRVSTESIVEGLRLAGTPTSLRDMRTDVNDDPFHVNFSGTEIYDISLVHVQPDPLFEDAYRRADLIEREPRPYKIAYWYWEFPSVPADWNTHAVDEVWAATHFVAQGLRARLSVPVKTLFPGAQLQPFAPRPRAHFGLPEQSFTFLFTFHMMSVMERKNPLGLIRAFQMAFADDEPVTLVLKTSFGERHSEQFEILRTAAKGLNIRLINEVYSSDEVLSLMDACDAYTSLHRSEGLGLTMAEAMLMGKPVIATNYSGNVDFMDDSNSLLVDYQLVSVGKNIPPYSASDLWAEPSIEHAAQLMRKVYDDPQWARDLGAAAQRSARERLSLEAAGGRIRERLVEINAARRSSR